MPVIAVDAMGGDHAPDEIVRGVADVSLGTDIDCLLVGHEGRIQSVLEEVPYNPERIAVLHARDTIATDEEATEAVRAHRDSSLVVALRAVAQGRADAIVSAGNAAACLVAAGDHFRLLPGVRRAALACVHPRLTEHPGQDPLALLLDVGATVRCDAEELVSFAVMGGAYARRISKVPNPKVGLLNMGAEVTAGGPVLAEAHRRLRALPSVDFVGNVEGHDLVGGRVDVVVSEGYAGNVALKVLNGVSEVLVDVAQATAEQKLVWRLGLRLLSRGIERVGALTDFRRYGGAPILGFDRLVLVCHARARGHAIANAVKVAAKAVRDRVPAEIADAVGGLA